MRVFNIIGIIATVGIFRYVSFVNHQYQDILWSSGPYYRHAFALAGIKNISMNAAFFMILFGIFFIILFGVNIKIIKRKTVKVISILGIIASSIYVLLNGFYIGNGSSSIFSPLFLIWWLFGFICLAFTIVLLVLAVRDHRRNADPKYYRNGDDVLDDFGEI